MGIRKALLFGLLFAIAIPYPIIADTFDNQPLTGIYHSSTAYTLERGGIEVGDIELTLQIPELETPFNVSQLKWVYINYGITDRFQVGTIILQNVLEGPNISFKYQFLEFPTARVSVAAPLWVNANLNPTGLVASTGLLLSWQALPSLGYHASFDLLASSDEAVITYDINLGLDMNISSNSKVLAETGFDDVRIGALTRFGPLNLQLYTDIPLTGPFGVTVDFELFMRF